MTHLLIPYDFSEEALHALDFATELADRLDNVSLEVLHVLETPTMTGFATMGGGESLPAIESQVFFLELTERRKKQMKELEEKHASKPYKFKTRLKLGNAFQGIHESIQTENPDLVIMGSKGTSGLEEVILGSNTEKVVRRAACPVITIKSAVSPKDIRKIVFASSFREHTPEIAARIKRLQRLFEATLYLVLVNTPSNFEPSRDSIKRIRDFAKTYDLENVQAEIYNAISEEVGIIQFAEDVDADLLAMTTTGRTGFLHLLTGSIAEDVVNHAKRPVWTLRVAD